MPNTPEILLFDLLEIGSLDGVKVRLQTSDGFTDPTIEYLKSPEIINTQWLLWKKKNRRISAGETIVGLLDIGNDQWLLTTVKKVTRELDVIDGVGYEALEVAEYAPYYGRTIVRYHRRSQQSIRKGSTIAKDLVVTQVLPSPYDGADFPGYDQVCLSFSDLDLIVSRGRRDWVSALSNQQAVYLIVDKSNGKQYVGSATSKSKMLLQRWTDYVSNGHGGNAELRRIVDEFGFDHVKRYFQYSILENFNSRTDCNFVLRREAWWKSALQTRQWGYNRN